MFEVIAIALLESGPECSVASPSGWSPAGKHLVKQRAAVDSLAAKPRMGPLVGELNS
jgi:hypothetical protein